MSRGSRQKVKHLGRKLTQIRSSLGLTQNGMIKALGLTDRISQDYISAYERGVREPPLPILLKYARLAKVSTDLLIDDALKLPARFDSRDMRRVRSANRIK